MAGAKELDSILPLHEGEGHSISAGAHPGGQARGDGADDGGVRGSGAAPRTTWSRSPSSGVARARPRDPERRPGMSIWPALMETIPTPVLVIDELEQIAVANAALRGLLEGLQRPYLGHPVGAILNAERLRIAAARLRDQPGEPRVYRDWLLVPEAPVEVLVRVDSLQSSTGDWLCVSLERSDSVEDRSRVPGRGLSHRFETLGQLAGSLAHDFNNQLSVIMTSLEMARRANQLGQDITDSVQQATEAALRSADAIGHVLRYSRRPRLDEQVLRPSAIVRELRGLLERCLGRGSTLIVQADAPAEVEACVARFETALLNLVLNARDATDGVGTVVVATEERHVEKELAVRHHIEPGYYCVLRVEDDGPGMPEEVRVRAVDPFFTTKPEGQGSGLGLTTVWEFARDGGGSVLIDSAPGQGTRVEVWLPCVERSRARGSKTKTLAPSSSRLARS